MNAAIEINIFSTVSCQVVVLHEGVVHETVFNAYVFYIVFLHIIPYIEMSFSTSIYIYRSDDSTRVVIISIDIFLIPGADD